MLDNANSTDESLDDSRRSRRGGPCGDGRGRRDRFADRADFFQAFGEKLSQAFDCDRDWGHHGRYGHGGPFFFGPRDFFGGFGPGGPGGRRGFGPKERFGGGFGGGRERMFDGGELKLVILKLLDEQPSYGYQLIKTMEERLSGGYAPSPGVIYPHLTMLEEEGLTEASTSSNNKKVYSVTAEGKAFLEENKRRIEDLFDRLEERGRGFERGRSPELMRAFMNLRGAVMTRMARNVSPEQMAKIVEAINTAAKSIDDL